MTHQIPPSHHPPPPPPPPSRDELCFVRTPFSFGGIFNFTFDAYKFLRYVVPQFYPQYKITCNLPEYHYTYFYRTQWTGDAGEGSLSVDYQRGMSAYVLPETHRVGG